MKEILLSILRRIHGQIITFNLFPLSSDIKIGIYTTRVYLVSLFIGVLILIFYASLSIQFRSITVYHPSFDVYGGLHNQYPSTLVCPCTRLSISHQSIVNVQVRFHQICSSDFIKDDAWLLYFKLSATSGLSFFSLDFRNMGFSLFNSIQILCRMAIDTVENELKVFDETQFVSAEVIPNGRFNTQTLTLIGQFEQQVFD